MLLATLLLASGLQEARPLQGDPLTGVWEGRGKGENKIIPPEGFAFSLVLEARGEDEAIATLTMDQAFAKPVEASFDPEYGELSFRCNLLGILVDVELLVKGEELTGKAAGLGMEVELAGKRTSHTLPAPPEPEAPAVDLTTLGPEAWREDLAFLAATLPAKHANAFHAIAREEWEKRVREIDGRLAELSPAASALALAQLVAAVGDAHTELLLRGRPFDVFLPVQFTWLADGVFVTAVDQRFADAMGKRVLRIGNAGVEEALSRVSTTFACENASWPHVQAPRKLAQPALLEALGLVPAASSISLGLEGADAALSIDASSSGTWLVFPTPLWQTRRSEGYWFQLLPDAPGAPDTERAKAVYVAYNRCAEDPARPMAGFMAEVFALLESSGAERLILDLRHNSGGNSFVLARFVPDLAAHPRLAAPGSLRVLIGPATYSAGMTNAHELRTGARARLYGEPTGGKPDSWGELRIFTLPRSGLEVTYSTQRSLVIGTDASAIEPDVLVPLTSADWFAGRDPVLARALAE